MKIKLCHRIIDDKGIECKEGDILLIQTHYMNSPSTCTVINIYTNIINVIFDNIINGKRETMIRIEDIILCRKRTE